MDNVNYNFQIIEALYVAKKQTRQQLFNKPIIISIMAIIECTLYDFIMRISQYRYDSFPNFTHQIASYFRSSKETDQLKILIPKLKSQNLLHASATDTIYDDLEHLRKVRNRIHIQNRHNELDRDEFRVFTDTELARAQQCLERVCEVLCNVYPRWNRQPIPMGEFPRPWL